MPRELLLTNATVITMDPQMPRAEALLARDGVIEAVGSSSDLKGLASADTVTMDLDGKTVIPGFIDSHIHALNLGFQEQLLTLTGMNKGEIISAALEYEKSLKPREILVGLNWDYPTCPNPTLKDLDDAFPDRPVLLAQFSGHGAWVNSRILKLLGVTPAKPSWNHGGADVGSDGTFTGILREPFTATRLSWFWIKKVLRLKLIDQALEVGQETLLRHGITSVHDNTWYPWVLGRIRRLYESGRLRVRFNCWSLQTPGLIDRWFHFKRFNERWFSRGPRKCFWDGAFSSHTAWLSEPYADKPETSGDGIATEKIRPTLARALRHGRQIAAHSIGDAAVSAYLSGFEQALAGQSAGDHRFRIEHGQLISPEDIRRIAELGMVVSAQPHAAATPEKDVTLVGADRALRAYPYRSLLDAGVPLAFGSDFPGENSFDPLFGIHLAVNREGPEAITPEEALAAYTTGSAYAEFAEQWKGRLAAGYVADLVVLNRDPTSVPAAQIKEIVVEQTFVDGSLEYHQ